MTILFAGGEFGSFLPSDSSVVELQAGLNPGYDPNYAREAIDVGASISSAAGWVFAATNAIWVHAFLDYLVAVGGPYPAIQVLAGAQVVFELTIDVNGNVKMYYWNGAALVQVGAGFQVPQGTQVFDIEINDAAIWCYVSGTTKDGANGSFPDVTAMTQVTLPGNNNFLRFSEIIVSDQPTLGYRLLTLAPTGNGADQQWNGSYTNIDGPITNDGSFISTPTPNEVSIFSHSTAINESIRAVVVTARVATTPGAPQHVELACYSGGNLALSPSLAVGTGFEPFVGVFANDPNTGSPWTTAAAEAAQFGVKSIA